MGDPVARGQRGVGHPDAVAVDPPAARADEERAGLPEHPHPEPAPLDRHPRPRLQVARTMIEQVAEQPHRHALGLRRSRVARAHDLRPARRVQLRNRPRVDQQHERHRRQDRREHRQCYRAADERNHMGDGRRGPHPPRSVEPLIARARTPVDPRELRKYLDARGYPPAIGLRRITIEASAGSSRTCSACPSPFDTTAK